MSNAVLDAASAVNLALTPCSSSNRSLLRDVQIKRVLASLYSGQSSYVTKCRTCRQESRMSSEVSEYFELDLQVCHTGYMECHGRAKVWVCALGFFKPHLDRI